MGPTGSSDMLSCKEVTEVCSLELEQPLSLGQRFGLGTHLMMCSGCTNYRTQLTVIRRAMQAYADGKAISGEGEPGSESRGDSSS